MSAVYVYHNNGMGRCSLGKGTSSVMQYSMYIIYNVWANVGPCSFRVVAGV